MTINFMTFASESLYLTHTSCNITFLTCEFYNLKGFKGITFQMYMYVNYELLVLGIY